MRDDIVKRLEAYADLDDGISPQYNGPLIREAAREVARLRAQIDAKRVDCSTCMNRGRPCGQDMYCDACIWGGSWKKDYYVSR